MKKFYISKVDFWVSILIGFFALMILMPVVASYDTAKTNEIKSHILEGIRSDGTSRIEVKDSWPLGFDSREWDSKNIVKRIKNLNFDNIEKISTEKDGDKIEVVVHFKNRQ